MNKKATEKRPPRKTPPNQPNCNGGGNGSGGGGGDLDVLSAPQAQEEDPPPPGLIPDPLGAPQPEGLAGRSCTRDAHKSSSINRPRARTFWRSQMKLSTSTIS